MSLEILQYDFMIRALIAGTLVGALAPILGTFLVLRRVSLIADTLAHVALLGVAIGLLTNIYPTLTTFIAVTIAAISIEQLRSRGKLPGDVALAVILYATMAAAILLISSSRGFNVDLFDFLFGSILALTPADIWALVILTVLVFIGVTIFFSELAQSSFDPDLAHSSGIRVAWINLGLALLTAATITLAMRILGLLLVGALVVVPFLVGQTLANSLRGAILTASLVGVISSITGLTVAFYGDLSAGGAIVLTTILMLGLAQIWRQARSR